MKPRLVGDRRGLLFGSVAGLGVSDLAQIPGVCCLSGGIQPVVFVLIFRKACVGAAVGAYHVPAPAVLLFKDARPAAEWAVEKFYLVIYVHGFSSCSV